MYTVLSAMNRSLSPRDDLTTDDIHLVEQQLYEPFNPEFSVEDEVVMSDAFTEDLYQKLPPSKRQYEQV